MGFWKNVEDRRVYLGLTRKDLAQQAGIKYAVIGAGLERDSIPAANTALRISKVLKNPPDYNRDDSQTRSGCRFITITLNHSSMTHSVSPHVILFP